MPKVIRVAIVNAFITLALLTGTFAQGTSTITICKKTIPPGGTGFPFNWQNGGGGTPTPFTLDDAGCQKFDVTKLDKLNKFTESVPPGWTLTNISCTLKAVNIIGPTSTTPAFEPGDDTVVIDLNQPSATCTFTNEKSVCPIRTHPTPIHGVIYCCTTDNDAPIGNTTGSFCCTQPCPPGTFETTVNGAAFCCDKNVNNPTGNNPAQFCCTKKSAAPSSTPANPQQ